MPDDFDEKEAGLMLPCGFIGKGSDIGRLAIFLASDEARHMAGQTICCDGGQTAILPVAPDFRRPAKEQYGKGYVRDYKHDRHREAPNASEAETNVFFFEVLAKMQNRVKELLTAGKVAIGAQLRFGSPAIAELFGHAGFDYIIPDCEHAPQTTTGVQAQLQAIACTPATPIVRVLKNDPETMRPFLDMGALGILAPFVNTARDAQIGARALRYPPRGTRGFGPSRAARYGLDDD